MKVFVKLFDNDNCDYNQFGGVFSSFTDAVIDELYKLHLSFEDVTILETGNGNESFFVILPMKIEKNDIECLRTEFYQSLAFITSNAKRYGALSGFMVKGIEID